MHANSLLAYEMNGIALDKREKLVLAAYIELYPTPVSDRYIMEKLGFTDMNAVRPRITSLRDKKVIEETGKMKCSITGQSVRHCRLVHKDPQLRLL